MASIDPVVKLTITPLPNGTQASVHVHYRLAGDAFDVAAQHPYHEICQLIGDDTPGDGTDDILQTLIDTTTFFPDPATSSPILERNIDVTVPMSVLDEDQSPFRIEPDEIRAKVTLIPRFNNFVESNLVQLDGGVLQRAHARRKA